MSESLPSHLSPVHHRAFTLAASPILLLDLLQGKRGEVKEGLNNCLSQPSTFSLRGWNFPSKARNQIQISKFFQQQTKQEVQTNVMCIKMSMRGSAKQQPCKRLKGYQALISSRRHPRRAPLQGDVQEEGQGEEWSDAGHLPSRHLPAANMLRPNHIHAIPHTICLRLFYSLNKLFQPRSSSRYQHRDRP